MFRKGMMVMDNKNFIAIVICIVIIVVISYIACVVMPGYLAAVKFVDAKANYSEPQETPCSKEDEVIENHVEAHIKNNKASEIYVVTAYDLSVQSCGKPIGHPAYGITASGYSLVGHTWYSVRVIAVDP